MHCLLGLVACNTVFTFQTSRSSRILALVPQDNAASEVSGTSDSENEFRISESSEAPSIDSSLERLHIDSSDDDDLNIAETVHTSPGENDNCDGDPLVNNISLPSVSSLPTMSPISSIPSITPSFIINQIGNSSQHSLHPSVSTPTANRNTRKRRRQQNTISNRPRLTTTSRKTKKIDLKFQWSKGRFQYCAELEPDV